MYKHHSYNNLVERKLQQLPAADTDGLWSNMEAILDQQMPQKKRRPGLWGWLFAHKAWMVATLVVGTAAGTTLVYVSGGSSPAAQQATLPGATDHRNTVATLAVTPALPPAITATAGQREAAAPAPTGNDASAPSALHPIQNNRVYTAAPAPVTASTQNTTTATDHTIPAAHDGTRNTVPVALSSNNTQSEVPNGAEQAAAADNSQPLLWAATTQAIAAEQQAAPVVDPAAVRLDTETLEHLSQHIAAAQKRGRLPQEKGPYVGVVAGLDLSSVEFGTMSTGNNKGIIAGYAFNNRWSVESGLLWNRKNYTADGSGFKADGYVPQAGLTILNVEGMSQIFEAPLNVKYNILAGRHRLFTTAGVSSYFIRKESLGVDYNFNGQVGYENRVYSDVSKHWLSVANFSLGYSCKLGSFGSLRVEPYVKLPLRDLGVGNMRVTSTGLNVGFIKMLR
ncbi:MAG TPA: hypothetical protein VGE66_05760 [Chitinophagaceae bacterium]